jgi:hypothetical protein
MGNPVITPQQSPPILSNPVQGATVRPQYVERNPLMWAVADTDLDGLGIVSVVSTVSFAVGSFCLGVAMNILVSYGGSDKLTDRQVFMLYDCTWMMGLGALLFFIFGGYLQYRKGSLWAKIKKESRQITPQ